MVRPSRSRLLQLAATAAAVAAVCAVSDAGVASSATPQAGSTGSLTTYAWGNGRSGDDTADPAITSVAATATWDDSLDGSVYGQPLVYGGDVYVATENDSIYALSATTGHVAWRVHVGSAAPLSIVDAAPTLSGGCGDIDPLGITGTPVIDTKASELFAVEETVLGGTGPGWTRVRHWLVAVSLKTHRELWHSDIDPPHANLASTYYIAAEQQRSALTLLDGRIYVEFGGLNGDCGKYHGYVASLTERGRNPLSYQVPTAREGAIWGTAGAVVSPGGNLYVTTGNGSSNTGYDEGNSVVELSPSLHRLGYYAPANWVQLNESDADIGSSSPIAVPGTTLLFAAGKSGPNGSVGYLMADSPLGGIGHRAYSGQVCPGGGVFGADSATVVASHTYLYAACGSGTEALLVHTTNPFSFSQAWHPSSGSPAGPPIVAGGYVWSLDWGGDTLYGMARRTGHVAFVRSTDSLNHFATPGFGDGMLVVPTQSGVEAFSTRG